MEEVIQFRKLLQSCWLLAGCFIHPSLTAVICLCSLSHHEKAFFFLAWHKEIKVQGRLKLCPIKSSIFLTQMCVPLETNSSKFFRRKYFLGRLHFPPMNLCGFGGRARGAAPTWKAREQVDFPPSQHTKKVKDKKATSELDDFQLPLWGLSGLAPSERRERLKSGRHKEGNKKGRERLASHSYSHCGPCRLNGYANRQLKVRKDNTKPTWLLDTYLSEATLFLPRLVAIHGAWK